MLTSNSPPSPHGSYDAEILAQLKRVRDHCGDMPPRVLVVDHSLREGHAAVTPLSAAGFDVTASRTFESAKSLLASGDYRLLITALRLGSYNGIHLVVRARARTPDIAAIVTALSDDLVLRTDAERLGATYVVLPVPLRELLAAIVRTCLRGPRPDVPLRPPFERRLVDRRRGSVAAAAERRGTERRAPPLIE
ncbi:MAG TPA: hypothetical protein VNK41_08510 [Vicinamibacterales bacterium]|nr:hypothetical protein [Vicinamibacterales bacterium]